MALRQNLFFRSGGIGLCALGLLGVSGPTATLRAEEDPTQVTSPESRVAWNTINRGSLRAMLQPVHDIRLSSRAAGIIERNQAEEGQSVHAGDPIIVLDSNQEKAEVAQAEAMVRGAQAELEHAQKDFDRVKPLTQDKIFSDKQFADAKYTFEVAQSRLAQAQATLSSAQVRFGNRTITSPIDGIFLKKTKNVGEAVERFETVARIVDVSSVKAEFFVDASLFDSFRHSRPVRIQVFRSQENYVTITADVSYVDPIIDSMSGTFRVRVQLPVSADVAPGYSAILLLQPLQGDNLGKP